MDCADGTEELAGEGASTAAEVGEEPGEGEVGDDGEG